MTGSGKMENKDFFKGKRMLVTGHTGFKGAWLAAVLNFMGADAAGYALAAQPGCLYEKICGDELIHSVTGELLDSRLLEQTVREVQPEIVIHLAGFGCRRGCLEDPVRAFQTNLMGSTVLLEALRKCSSVKSIVLESNCQSFEDKSDSPVYNGEEGFGEADPYSSSKICMEYMAQDYQDLYFQTDRLITGIAVVRAGSVSGSMAHDESTDADTNVEHMGNDLAGGFSSAPDLSVEESEDGIHRLLLPKCRQHVLDVLDSYLSVSRLMYERPLIYSGKWEIEQRQKNRSGSSCEKDVGQLKGFLKCRIDGATEREICMKIVSMYYSNLGN